VCNDLSMPRIPTTPTALAFLLYRTWKRLPPKQRRQLLNVARTHGPRVAAAAAAAAKTRAGRRSS
jgi:hypothetical protein